MYRCLYHRARKNTLDEKKDCLLTLLKVLQTSLATEQFKASMRNCFKDVGLAPAELTHDGMIYKQYIHQSQARLTEQSTVEAGVLSQ